jgi:uncharacterized protein YgiM (DUF1202 family)
MNLQTINHDQLDAQGFAAETISRRRLLSRGGKLTAGMLALTLARKTALDAQPASAASYFAAAIALNLRTGPGVGYSVIQVIPQGGVMTDSGVFQNNYRKVTYKGITGWVSQDFLIVSDGGGNVPTDIVGGAKTVSAANLRSGPSTGHQVLRVVPAGALVQTTLKAQNGFRYVVHNGLAGWIFDELLDVQEDGESPGSLTVTDYLNLRAEPSLSAKVLKMLAPGQIVTPLGPSQNGFRKVSAGSTTGWAYATYLK